MPPLAALPPLWEYALPWAFAGAGLGVAAVLYVQLRAAGGRQSNRDDQLAGLIKTLEGLSALQAETEQRRTDWLDSMAAVGSKLNLSARALQEAIEQYGQAATNLGGCADSLAEATTRQKELIAQSLRAGDMAAHLGEMTRSVAAISAQLSGASGSMEQILVRIDRSVSEMSRQSAEAYERYLERNNSLVSTLQEQFRGWRAAQERMALDMSGVLSGLSTASQEYAVTLSRTRTALLDTAGLDRMIEQTALHLRDWQLHLESLHTAYTQMLEEGKE